MNASIAFPQPFSLPQGSGWPQRVLQDALYRVTELFHVGSWPWFGAADVASDAGVTTRGQMTPERGESGGGSSFDPDGPEMQVLGQRAMPFYHLPVLMQAAITVSAMSSAVSVRSAAEISSKNPSGTGKSGDASDVVVVIGSSLQSRRCAGTGSGNPAG